MSDDLQRYRPEYPGFMMPDPDGVWVDRRDVADRIEALEAKLARVTAAYRREAMRREDYSHEAFALHLAEITGETDD